MAKTIENEKPVAILSYFLVGIIWFFVDEKVKKSDFAKFHVKQALNLAIISFVFSFIAGFLTLITLGLFALIAVPINIAILVLWIMGIVYSAQGEKKMIPLVGKFAEKYLTF